MYLITLFLEQKQTLVSLQLIFKCLYALTNQKELLMLLMRPHVIYIRTWLIFCVTSFSRLCAAVCSDRPHKKSKQTVPVY